MKIKTGIITAAIACTSILFITVLYASICWNKMNSVPDIHRFITKDISQKPKPNAFDYYHIATKDIKDKSRIRKAHSIISRTRGNISSSVSPTDNAYIKRVVNENFNVLTEAERGFPYPYQGPEYKSINQTFPYISGFRNIAYLWGLRAYIKLQNKEYKSAIDNSLNAMELGSDVSQDAGLLSVYIYNAFQKSGRAIGWEVIDKLDRDQTLKSLKRLQKIRAEVRPYYKTVEQERNILLTSLWNSMYTNKEEDPFLHLNELQNWKKRRIFYLFADHFDKAIEYAKKPYSTNNNLEIPKLSYNPITMSDNIAIVLLNIWLPSYDSAYYSFTETDTLNSLFEVSLALHAYKLQNGKYPNNLDQLSIYCKSPARDPFSVRNILKYRKKANGYLLYSVGPDGVDNGGQPITVTNQYDRKEAKGDIVAGIMKI